jgi:hypothetical protein
MRARRSGMGVGWVAAVTLLVAPAGVGAQTRQDVSGVVGDLRLVTSTLPTAAGWTPASDTGEVVPGRGFGGEIGAHALVGPGRHKRLGVGVSGVFVQGRAAGAAGGNLTTRLTAIAPHFSANFGHRGGWSYLSGGAGLARVTSIRSGGASDPAGWSTVFHYGAGARWFLTERVAFSLDLRFWALAPRGGIGDRPNAPANTRIALGAGVSVR